MNGPSNENLKKKKSENRGGKESESAELGPSRLCPGRKVGIWVVKYIPW